MRHLDIEDVVVGDVKWRLSHLYPLTRYRLHKINFFTIRAAKSKFLKPGVFRKKPGANQKIHDEKPGDKPVVYSIKTIQWFLDSISKKTRIFVNISAQYYLLPS